MKTESRKQTYMAWEEKEKEEGEERDREEKDGACLTPCPIAISGGGLCPSRKTLPFRAQSREVTTKDSSGNKIPFFASAARVGLTHHLGGIPPGVPTRVFSAFSSCWAWGQWK